MFKNTSVKSVKKKITMYKYNLKGLVTELLTESIKMNDFAFLSEAEGWEKYTSTKYSVPGSRQTGVCRIAILFSKNEAQL